jgi:methionyl-tRNA synthetase
MNIQTLIIDEISKNPSILIILIWSIIWKMIAWWKSARNNDLVFFILITFLNTMGILEISYIVYLYYKNKNNKN